MIKRIEDLGIWLEARKLCQNIYLEIQKGSFAKDWGLKDQINRSSGSVMDNIAEGFGRMGNKEFIQFLCISKASCFEVRSQLYRAHDRSHISPETLELLLKITDELSNRIGGFINYLKKSDYNGLKFKEPLANYGIGTIENNKL